MYHRILIPVDGSVASLKGLDEALKLAQAMKATIKLVHVVNEMFYDASYVPSVDYSTVVAILREAGKKVLADAESFVRERGAVAETELIEQIGVHAADKIVQAARQWSADLIVMGTHGRRGLRRLALGSDAELVLRSSPVPVLMVRSTPET